MSDSLDEIRRACLRCRAVLPLRCFRRTGRAPYRRHICLACHRQWERAYRQRQDVRQRRVESDLRTGQREKTRLRMRRQRQKERG